MSMLSVSPIRLISLSPAPLQQSFGGGRQDVFVAKLNPSGGALSYSTYLGGSGIDAGFAIAVDSQGNVYVMGQTDPANFPTMNALQVSNGGGTADVFIAKLQPGPVVTEVRLKKTRLIITGSGFEQGAVILLDGGQQKTKFKSSTSLKGKKLALKIAPGAMVRLQVRNPDGTTSAEFSFTRAAQSMSARRVHLHKSCAVTGPATDRRKRARTQMRG